MKKQYLMLENLQIEPLFNQWYVTLPMLAPVPSAMALAYTHIPIMQSYVNAPEEHLLLSKDRLMTGGPFINYQRNRSKEIQALLDNLFVYQQHIINFAEAVKTLLNYLEHNTCGYSLETEYVNVPGILKGFVELTYDLSNHSSVRFIEPLLYKSPFYSKTSQSVCCSLVQRDERHFVLSTPRLIENNQLQIDLPFDSPLYDTLCRMREYPASLDTIIDNLNIPHEKISLFKSFFKSSNNKIIKDDYTKNSIRVRYFGHACLLIEYNGTSILVDPFISYQYKNQISRFTLSDLPQTINYVLITHGHLDHIVLETLLQIRYKIENIIIPRNAGTIHADPSLKLLLNNLGFKGIIEVDELEEIIPGHNITITTMPFFGEHHDLNIRTKSAYLLLIEDKKIYIGADSSNLEPALYNKIQSFYGDVDILFLGMECDGAPLSWFYGHLMPKKLDRDKDHSRQGSGSDYKKAIKMVESLKPKAAYIYAMGLEPWFTYVLGLNIDKNSKQIIESDLFIAECKKRGITSERLYAKKELLL